MLTVDDLVNTNNISGYSNVHYVGYPKATKWRAKSGEAKYGPLMDKSGDRWKSAHIRLTPTDAAQDYCDHANAWHAANPTAPTTTLKRANHKRVGPAKSPRNPNPAPRQITPGFIYFIGDGTAIKIGKSKDHPSRRIGELQTGNPRILTLVRAIETLDIDTAEKSLHLQYAAQSVLGEWFDISAEAILTI